VSSLSASRTKLVDQRRQSQAWWLMARRSQQKCTASDLDVSGVALYRVTTTSSSWDIVLTMSGALAQGVRFYVWGAGSGTAVVATNSVQRSCH
jgi:hypothetical protein